MSGFAGIIHLDGAPVDRDLVERMARLTERHGGDAFNVYCGDSFGFGHSLLASMPESHLETQPFSFDGEIWIVGDVRVDARTELVAQLRASGCTAELSRPDIELVLHAYHLWGEHCVDHLVGDFAFAIWSRAKRQLFCARDIFGIKPFYFQRCKDTFLFSNEIQALQPHPLISSALHEPAICDFLVFEFNLDQNRTCFADIQRLPANHTLIAKPALDNRLARYRGLEANAAIRYPTMESYCEHFLELLRQSVADRLRSGRVAFELSGGLDSTSIAAVSTDLNSNNPEFSGLGITVDDSSQNPQDEEARYAGIAAKHLGIGHATHAAAPLSDLYASHDTPEPYVWPFVATLRRYGAAMREFGQVMLTGHGGDPLCAGSGYELLDRYRSGSMTELASWLMSSAIKKRSVRGLGWRALVHRDLPRISMPTPPGWVRTEFLARSDSEARWRHQFYRKGRYPAWCQSELAWDDVHSPFWSYVFESGYHSLYVGVDCRHPFFDRRVADFLLSVPASVLRDKRLLRTSMKNLLPDTIIHRPKSPVLEDIVQSRLQLRPEAIPEKTAMAPLDGWIDSEEYLASLEAYAGGKRSADLTIVCPLSLLHWLTEKDILR